MQIRTAPSRFKSRRRTLPVFGVCVLLFANLIALPLPPIHAQGNLGAYYSNMYFQNKTAMNFLERAGGGSACRTTRRRATVRSASPVWSLRPRSAAIINKMVVKAPAENRAKVRGELVQILASYPVLVQAVNRASGISLRATNVHDTATLAGALLYEELSGKDLTKEQILAERTATRRLWAKSIITRD